MKNQKKITITTLKKILWELCRQITIKRHGRKCYTCGKAVESLRFPIQTGHFITSSTCSVEVRYSLDNLRPQCFHCNINLSGNWVAFEKHLLKDGIDIDAIKKRNEETKGIVYPLSWYQEKIEEYKKLV